MPVVIETFWPKIYFYMVNELVVLAFYKSLIEVFTDVNFYPNHCFVKIFHPSFILELHSSPALFPRFLDTVRISINIFLPNYEV